MRVGVARALTEASGVAKFTKICDSLPWTPMNRRAKCDAASFILGGEIRNRTNKQTVNPIVSLKNFCPAHANPNILHQNLHNYSMSIWASGAGHRIGT